MASSSQTDIERYRSSGHSELLAALEKPSGDEPSRYNPPSAIAALEATADAEEMRPRAQLDARAARRAPTLTVEIDVQEHAAEH